MQWPPSIRIELASSPRAMLLIGLLAAITCGVIAVLPFEPALLVAGMVVIVVWAVDRIYVVAFHQGARAVREFELRADLTVMVMTGDGTTAAGRVRAESYVGARLTTLVWRPFGRWRSRSIFILPDMLPPRDFRRLRVLLRYGRSEVTQGDPASHA